MNKECSKCGEVKPLNKEFFEPRNNTKDGFRNQCRECRRRSKRDENGKYKYKSKQNKYKRKNNREVGNKWTKEEKEILIKYYPYMNNFEIQEKFLPNRTVSQIMDHSIKVLKLKKDKNFHVGWTQNQIDYLKTNYSNDNFSVDEISNSIGKSRPTVTAMANSLGLFREKEGIFSEKEKQIIKEYYSQMKTIDLKNKFNINKTVQQITKFANDNQIYKNEELGRKIRIETAINNLINTNNSKKPTNPEIIIMELMDKLNITYQFQKLDKYYWLDFYLSDINLIIEVQGDYFHCNPTLNLKYNVLDKDKLITKDKRKHSYFRNKGIEILYLWEYDIINFINKCELLITDYINKHGKLFNYHSFNFNTYENKLNINENLITIGY